MRSTLNVTPVYGMPSPTTYNTCSRRDNAELVSLLIVSMLRTDARDEDVPAQSFATALYSIHPSPKREDPAALIVLPQAENRARNQRAATGLQ